MLAQCVICFEQKKDKYLRIADIKISPLVWLISKLATKESSLCLYTLKQPSASINPTNQAAHQDDLLFHDHETFL